MTTEHLVMLHLEDPRPTPRSSKTAPKKTEVVEDDDSEPEQAQPKERDPLRAAVSQFKSIHAWGVKDRNGNWVEVPGNEQRATHDACNLLKSEALKVFATHPYAFQLISGCDWWACLSDEDEVLVVEQENPDVPAPEAVPGASSD